MSRFRGAWNLVFVAVVMGAASGWMAYEAAQEIAADQTDGDTSAWPHYDLTTTAIPQDVSGFVVVEGFLRDELVLAEHNTVDGKRPNQNQKPEYVLVPLVGEAEGTVELDGAVVVARVPEAISHFDGKRTHSGQIKPAPDEIVNSLVAFSINLSRMKTKPTGVILDTGSRPDSSRAKSWLAIAGVSGILALVFLGMAFRSRPHGD